MPEDGEGCLVNIPNTCKIGGLLPTDVCWEIREEGLKVTIYIEFGNLAKILFLLQVAATSYKKSVSWQREEWSNT
jgi:hypothetical protein